MYTIRRQSSRPPRSLTLRPAVYVGGAFMMVMTGTVAGAQGQTASVRVTPDVAVVDHATHTTKVQLVNTTGDWATADLTLQYALPPQPGTTVSAADSAKTDSLAKRWALTAWVKNLKPQLMLAPHETVTVTLTLTVPPSLQSGEYSTYLVTRSGKMDRDATVMQALLDALSGGTLQVNWGAPGTGNDTGGGKDSTATGGKRSTPGGKDSTGDAAQRHTARAQGLKGRISVRAGGAGQSHAAQGSPGDTRPFVTAKIVYRTGEKVEK